MITAQLKTAVLLVAIFLAGSIAAKAIGSLQPINPALRGFIEGCEDKPQPCWYGIVPGVTTLEEAKTNLLKREFGIRGDQVLFWIDDNMDTECRNNFTVENNRVAVIELDDCKDIKIGAIAALVGKPLFVILDPQSTWLQGNVQGILRFLHFGLYRWDKFSANDYVSRITLFPSGGNQFPQLRWDWHGFTRVWRYCQFEHIRGLC